MKDAIRKLFSFFLVLILMISCQNAPTYKRNTEKYFQYEPVKTASFQILDQGTLLGYAHKYEWDSKKGELLHYYVIFNKKGDMVAHIRDDGQTTRCLSNGTFERLGHFSLEKALENIFEKAVAIEVVPFSQDKEYLAVVEKERKRRKEVVVTLSPEDTPESKKSKLVSIGGKGEPSSSSLEEEMRIEKEPITREETPVTKSSKPETREGKKSTEAIAKPEKTKEKIEKPQTLEEWPDENEPWLQEK